MRGYTEGRVTSISPSIIERVICALSYLTGGMIGFVWIIISYVTRKSLKPFTKFHAYQSVFISVLYYLFTIIISILLAFLKIIPFIGTLALSIVYYLTQMPILFGLSLFDAAVCVLILYLVSTCLLGKFGNVPWVSDNIKRMV